MEVRKKRVQKGVFIVIKGEMIEVRVGERPRRVSEVPCSPRKGVGCKTLDDGPGKQTEH